MSETESLPSGRPVRVLVVDDHPLVRDGLRELIRRAANLEVCGTAASASETLEALAGLDPDLVVLDLSLGDSDGTQLIRKILERSQRARVLVVSTYEEAAYAERCMRAGAHGYLNKRMAVKDIRHAIGVIAEGGLFFGESVRARRAPSPTPENDPDRAEAGPEVLSDRELEVFQWLGRGHGPTQIGGIMGVSVKTVEGYMARIKIKLGLDSADELSQLAVNWYRGPDR